MIIIGSLPDGTGRASQPVWKCATTDIPTAGAALVAALDY